MGNDSRWPNETFVLVLGSRRVGISGVTDDLDGLLREAFFESDDPVYPPYVPPTIPECDVVAYGDYGWPNPMYSQWQSIRRSGYYGPESENLETIGDELIFGSDSAFAGSPLLASQLSLGRIGVFR